MNDEIFAGFPRYFVRMVHEFPDYSPSTGETKIIRNTHWIMKRFKRWDECRGYASFPEQARLRSLTEARRAANSSYVRQHRGSARVEIVRETRDGDLRVVSRDPQLSALEQLASVAL